MKFTINFTIVLTVLWPVMVCLAKRTVECPHTSPIVGGNDAKPGANPHMCSLQYDGRHWCGAAIISDKWAITAAHCLKGLDLNKIILRCGSLFHARGGIDYIISQVVAHDAFNQYGDNDIGLVQINDKFELGTRKINSIVLPEQGSNLTTGLPVTVIGWGYLDYWGDDLAHTLQTVDVPVVDHEKCRLIYQDYNRVTRNMFCAGLDAGGKDACQSDSGGPVKYNNVLVGIISWGHECAQPLYYGVYTQVGNYRNWIRVHSGV